MSQPPEPGPVSDIPGYTLMGHLGLYFIFGLLLCKAAAGLGRFTAWMAFFAAFIIGAIYGLSDELHQFFVPGRQADVLDWAVDMLGTSLGALALQTHLLRGNKTYTGAHK